MHVKIYDTDTARDVAEKVYYKFDVMASCSVYGFVMNEKEEKLIPKGEAVLKHLEMFDEIENIRYVGEKKVRKHVYRKESIGGPISQKIFTWEKRIVDNEPRYTIWRYQ